MEGWREGGRDGGRDGKEGGREEEGMIGEDRGRLVTDGGGVRGGEEEREMHHTPITLLTKTLPLSLSRILMVVILTFSLTTPESSRS